MPEVEPALAPLAPVALASALAARLRRHPTVEPVETLAASERPTLQARAEVVFAALGGGGWVRLDGLLGTDVPTAVATFLALLALVRRGLVVVRQAEWNACLEIRRQSLAPPCLATSGRSIERRGLGKPGLSSQSFASLASPPRALLGLMLPLLLRHRASKGPAVVHP